MRSDAPSTSTKVNRFIVVSLGSSSMWNSSCQWSSEGTLCPHISGGAELPHFSILCCSCTTTAEDSDFTMEPIILPKLYTSHRHCSLHYSTVRDFLWGLTLGSTMSQWHGSLPISHRLSLGTNHDTHHSQPWTTHCGLPPITANYVLPEGFTEALRGPERAKRTKQK